MRRNWLVSWGLGAVSFGGASLLVPLYIVRLGASPFDLGIMAAAAAIIAAPGAILFGRLASGASHRRALVLLTLATATVTLSAIPLLQSIRGVIVVNTIFWFVIASVGPVVTMLVVENTPESEWSTQIGVVNTYYGYGWAGGLVLGMVWPLLGTRLFEAALVDRGLFWLLAGVAGLSTLSAAWTLPKPDPADDVTTARTARRVARLLARSGRHVRGATFVFPANRLYWSTRGFRVSKLGAILDSTLSVFLLASGLFFAGFAAFWAPLPHLLAGVGYDSGHIFGLYLLSSLSGAVLFEPVGKLARRTDEWWLVGGALAVRGVLFPIVAVGAGLGLTALGIVLLGGLLLAVGITWAVIAVVGTTIVTRLAPPGLRGEALGSYVAIGAVAGGIGSALGGWLATFGFLHAFAVAGGLVLSGSLLVVSLRDRSTEPPSKGDG
ncbi:MAG: MFS transporter [Halodesulfurarchaeum sp.]|nr:MFS transporter [Halodesulfurarchaeum sp.]